MAPRFFESPSQWREWLAGNHSKETSLLVGLHKPSSGRRSITWSESVDEALCFGWIDGVRKSLGEASYSIRFSARRPSSIWSKINIAKAEALIASGRMTPAGLAKFEARRDAKSGVYSYEQAAVAFDGQAERRFRANRAAWGFFRAQAPSYRKMATWWVTSARRPSTRDARLATLIETSQRKKRI